MGRILAIDYGVKRCGLAVTDPLQIIATALDTVSTNTLIDFLKTYTEKETVDSLVIGMPKTLKNEDSETAPRVRQLIVELKKIFPFIPVYEVDERFTSTIAKRAMIDGGVRKKARQEKAAIDRISATLILQNFLDSHR